MNDSLLSHVGSRKSMSRSTKGNKQKLGLIELQSQYALFFSDASQRHIINQRDEAKRTLPEDFASLNLFP